MQSMDTNILFYAFNEQSNYHTKAKAIIDSYRFDAGVIICEYVLVELYMLLRNPKVLVKPLSAQGAVFVCQAYRNHPRWQILESACVMDEVWQLAADPQVSRRRIIDFRIAKTLLKEGVDTFITANDRDFQGLGFKKIINPFV